MITGQDLVEWQLRVAAGETLPRTQAQLGVHGHAIEARLYAEDPARDFLPSIGTLWRLRPPAADANLRIDTGVREGDAVTIHYDPMIAKLIAWGEDRAAALRHLRRGLAAYEIAGVSTNRDFLYRIAAHPEFTGGAVDTGFIPRHQAELRPPPQPAPLAALAAASLTLLIEQQAASQEAAARTGDAASPWQRRDGWRLNGETYQDLVFGDGAAKRAVRIHYRRDGYRLDLDGVSVEINGEMREDGALALELDGARSRVMVVRRDEMLTVAIAGTSWRLIHRDPLVSKTAADAGGGLLTAPMPGRIAQIAVVAGATVKRGQPLLMLEAMKMEHVISAPADGLVERLHVAMGDLVEEGAELIVFTAGGKEVGDVSAG
jgi:3-methylcrotonyl-CoA carboxylase alpha subunit